MNTVVPIWHDPEPSTISDEKQTEETVRQGFHRETDTDDASLVDREIFTRLMRLMPHGLVLIFAGERRISSESLPWQGEEGMLVSSFTSVAVNPKPYVSFNVKLPSITYEKIKKTSTFTVVAVKNATFADAFTKRNEDRDIIYNNFRNRKTSSNVMAQGAVWWMRCVLSAEHILRVEDHAIVIGKVVDQGAYKDGDEERALVYFDGKYRLLGGSTSPDDDAHLIPGLLPRKRMASFDSKSLKRVEKFESRFSHLERSLRHHSDTLADIKAR